MTATVRPTPVRPRLTRALVVEAAVALADGEGLGATTMRRVGDALGVEAMSLYHHVESKAALLDGMVDLVVAEIGLPEGDATTWREVVRGRCVAARAVLARHPWAVELLSARRAAGAATLDHHDALLGVLIGAGLSLPLAGHAVAALDSYTFGFALQEHAVAGSARGAGAPDAPPADVADGSRPHLAAFAAVYALKGGYDFGAEFEWGLDLVLDGLEQAVARERRARRGQGRRS